MDLKKDRKTWSCETLAAGQQWMGQQHQPRTGPWPMQAGCSKLQIDSKTLRYLFSCQTNILESSAASSQLKTRHSKFF
jgi:hypothetical protein